MNDWGDRIVSAALPLEGQEFRPGVKAQCMNFVRHVLERAKHPYAAKVTSRPVDGHWTGPALASSLAGRDLGQMITRIEDLEPGDVVFWNDTYNTGFPPGTITHVGIALGPEKFIHRNTMSAPVNIQPFAGFWRDRFRCALRVPQEVEPSPGVRAPDPEEHPTSRIWMNSNGATLEVREPIAPGRYSMITAGGADGAWLLKLSLKQKG